MLNVLRPVKRQPPSARTAIVSGFPPRLGLPDAASLAKELIIAPSRTLSRHSSANSGSGHLRHVRRCSV